jgi:hypothetical protein
MDLDKREVWVVVAAGAAALSSVLVRRGLDGAWRLARHEDPPDDPAAPDVDWKDAVLWTVATGVAIGLARLLARRGAAAGWHRLTGEAPPG